jgi:hypothetical protein
MINRWLWMLILIVVAVPPSLVYVSPFLDEHEWGWRLGTFFVYFGLGMLWQWFGHHMKLIKP